MKIAHPNQLTRRIIKQFGKMDARQKRVEIAQKNSSVRLAISLGLIAASAIVLSLVCSLSAIAQDVSSGPSSNGGGGSCHLRELDLCAASMLVFTQNPNGLATSEAEINKQCVHLKEADKCLRSYTRRCMTPIQRELVMLAANSSFQLLDEYCLKGSKLRHGYLKHAQCLNQIQKRQEHKGCMRDLQVALELLTANQIPTRGQKFERNHQNATQSDTNGKRLQLSCCAFRRLESCLGSQTEKRCGKEAIQFVQSVMRRATSRLPEVVCHNFKPDGPECRALLAKDGVTPRGAKSGSIISRLLSAYSGL